MRMRASDLCPLFHYLENEDTEIKVSVISKVVGRLGESKLRENILGPRWLLVVGNHARLPDSATFVSPSLLWGSLGRRNLNNVCG